MAQLTTLLIAITAFAIPSLGSCTPAPALLPAPYPGYESYELTYVELGVGVQTFTCNAATGAYEYVVARCGFCHDNEEAG